MPNILTPRKDIIGPDGRPIGTAALQGQMSKQISAAIGAAIDCGLRSTFKGPNGAPIFGIVPAIDIGRLDALDTMRGYTADLDAEIRPNPSDAPTEDGGADADPEQPRPEDAPNVDR